MQDDWIVVQHVPSEADALRAELAEANQRIAELEELVAVLGRAHGRLCLGKRWISLYDPIRVFCGPPFAEGTTTLYEGHDVATALGVLAEGIPE